MLPSGVPHDRRDTLGTDRRHVQHSAGASNSAELECTSWWLMPDIVLPPQHAAPAADRETCGRVHNIGPSLFSHMKVFAPQSIAFFTGLDLAAFRLRLTIALRLLGLSCLACALLLARLLFAVSLLTRVRHTQQTSGWTESGSGRPRRVQPVSHGCVCALGAAVKTASQPPANCKAQPNSSTCEHSSHASKSFFLFCRSAHSKSARCQRGRRRWTQSGWWLSASCFHLACWGPGSCAHAAPLRRCTVLEQNLSWRPSGDMWRPRRTLGQRPCHAWPLPLWRCGPDSPALTAALTTQQPRGLPSTGYQRRIGGRKNTM